MGPSAIERAVPVSDSISAGGAPVSVPARQESEASARRTRRPLRAGERRLALAGGDTLAAAIATLLALWTWWMTAGGVFDAGFLREHVVWWLVVPIWVVLLGPTREAHVALHLRRSAPGIARAAAGLLVIYIGVFFVTGAGAARLPRLVALYLLWDATLLTLAWRLLARWMLTRPPFSRRVVVVGSGRAREMALRLLTEPAFRGVEILDDAEPGGADVRPIDERVEGLDVTDVVVAVEGEPGEALVRQLLRCQELGVDVVRMAELYERTLKRVPIAHIGLAWLLTNFLDVAGVRERSPIAKRALDLTVASALSLAGLLLGPVIALAILIESGRPIFYRQVRLGRGGRPFDIVKFRTMRPDAERGGPARWSPPGDPRVTRMGRVLRRTRLDELPNVLAILRGEMSVAGPRPERPEFVQQLEREVPFYRARLIVRPGLTGWAQVNAPYGDSVGDATVKLEYDLYYIKHQSIWFDALILLRTVATIFRLQGR
jgi:exopolysaccharide biosynthesis polyprenyl glycosylphosphotransferase